MDRSSGFHPNNPHIGPYPFEDLAIVHPDLDHFLKPKKNKPGRILDFSNPQAVQSLNQALLVHHYGIKNWSLSNGYLCPAVPGRMDYLCHLEDLIGDHSQTSKTTLLDIGTGANGIYALLAAAHFSWKVIACDINSISLQHLTGILRNNDQLINKIELRHQPITTQILRGILKPEDEIAVTVCNPPFYTSSEQATAAHREKHRAHQKRNLASDPEVRSTQGIHPELVFPGGEVAFVKTLIKESQQFKHQIHWFTTLLSRSSSIQFLEKELETVQVKRYQVIPMQHGNKTARILCWTYRK